MSFRQSYVFLVLTLILTITDIVQLVPVPTTTKKQAVMYLSKFGYLPSFNHNRTNDSLWDSNILVKAVKDFQSFSGLNITGELNEETMKLISLPRCGVSDKFDFSPHYRSKRYALQGSRWHKNNLTYKIYKYPKRMMRGDVDAEIFAAFAVWSTFTDLSFTEQFSDPVDIEIKFVSGEHGDGDPFDGRGGALAHAAFPEFGGDIHFDDDERWTMDSSSDSNLFKAAAHEIGHTLGLLHSSVPSALMAPFNKGYGPKFQMDDDDLLAINELYSKKSEHNNHNVISNAVEADTLTRQQSKFDTKCIPAKTFLCKNPKIDAVFKSADGHTYAFKCKGYYKLIENAVAKRYPKLITQGWPGLPAGIDAAFTYKSKTYFFKDTQYWKFSGRKVHKGYPKKISKGFPGVPDYLDAAMFWSGNKKIYFFKGSKFWRYDPLKRLRVKSNCQMAKLKGLPNSLDAAIQHTNGYAYLFKDDKYYRFNFNTTSIDLADPTYPRPTGDYWLGCRNTTTSANENYENLI